MTVEEFVLMMKSRGVYIDNPPSRQEIVNINLYLQQIGAAILPNAVADLYSVAGGMIWGSAYIFAPKTIEREMVFPVPDLVTINKDIQSVKQLHGLTVFGRNDLFWFAFDAFGKYQMLHKITLESLRKYDDIFRAITDCLAVGK